MPQDIAMSGICRETDRPSRRYDTFQTGKVPERQRSRMPRTPLSACGIFFWLRGSGTSYSTNALPCHRPTSPGGRKRKIPPLLFLRFFNPGNLRPRPAREPPFPHRSVRLPSAIRCDTTSARPRPPEGRKVRKSDTGTGTKSKLLINFVLRERTPLRNRTKHNPQNNPPQ